MPIEPPRTSSDIRACTAGCAGSAGAGPGTSPIQMPRWARERVCVCLATRLCCHAPSPAVSCTTGCRLQRPRAACRLLSQAAIEGKYQAAMAEEAKLVEEAKLSLHDIKLTDIKQMKILGKACLTLPSHVPSHMPSQRYLRLCLAFAGGCPPPPPPHVRRCGGLLGTQMCVALLSLSSG